MKTHGLAGDYRYDWHHSHDTCAGWLDVVTFARDVGERPPRHGLTKTTDDVASCGTCADCLAVGAARNVIWTPGGSAVGGGVDYGGERMSQAEAARREGVSRAAMSRRVLMGKPVKSPTSNTG